MSSSLTRPAFALYAGLVAFIIVVGAHLLWFGYHSFAEDQGILPVGLAIMTLEVFGVSLVYFLLKGRCWARYALVIFTTVGLVFVLFLPVTVHAHERTTYLIACVAVVCSTFGYLDYLLLFHQETRSLLKSRQRS
jgi:hypothetical protein